MSGKISKWKEVKPTTDRLNKIFYTKPAELPCKFAPKRDCSQSVDKLFNSTRSRLHSSMELTALNKTRQQQFVDAKKQTLQIERKQQLEKKPSSLYPNLALGERQSSHIFQGSQCVSGRSSQIIWEIKKQYQIFKKNVLAELQRQRQMVQKILKQIVLTFQYEIGKLTDKQINIAEQIKVQNMKEDYKIKSIEDWKNQLTSVTIADTTKIQKRIGLKQLTNLNTNLVRPSKQKRQDLQPPKLDINFDSFLGCVASIKKQMDEMKMVLERPQELIDQKFSLS